MLTLVCLFVLVAVAVAAEPTCTPIDANGKYKLAVSLKSLLDKKADGIISTLGSVSKFLPESAKTCVGSIDIMEQMAHVAPALNNPKCAATLGLMSSEELKALMAQVEKVKTAAAGGMLQMLPAINAMLKWMKAVPHKTHEKVCSDYTEALYGCMVESMVPALMNIFASLPKCCDSMLAEVKKSVGMELDAFAQVALKKVGNTICSKGAHELCGYGVCQSYIADTGVMGNIALYLNSLGLPNDQGCRAMEGKQYKDLDGQSAKLVFMAPFSGCATGFDNLLNWIASLPVLQSLTVRGIKVMDFFADGKKVTFLQIFEALPADLQAKLGILKSMLSSKSFHFANGYSATCKYSRPWTSAKFTAVVPTDAPDTDAPITDAPDTDAPITDAPDTDAPITDAPDTDAPITDAPDTDAPITDAPDTDAPITDAPITDAPVVTPAVTPAPSAC